MNAKHIEKITPILKRQGVTKAAVFGSVARGTAKRGSDIDLLINLKKGKTLFDMIRLKFELEQMLKKKVDLVEYSAIRPVIRNRILAEQKTIYGQFLF